MNILVFSDIHGSKIRLEKVLEKLISDNYDKIIICGDLLYHGARNPLPEGYDPKGVTALLNSLKTRIVAVRGNCESEVDQMVLEFPVLGDYSYYNIDGRTIFITHGHGYAPENLPPLESGDIFLSGHTHLPVAKEEKSIYICNPGSISLPKGGYEPSYGILNKKGFVVKELFTDKIIYEVNF